MRLHIRHGLTASAMVAGLSMGVCGWSSAALATTLPSYAQPGVTNASPQDGIDPRVAATIAVGHKPSNVAVNPRGTRAYTADAGANAVSVIDTATNAVITTVGVGTNPTKVVVSPDGARAYVANFGPDGPPPDRLPGTVSVIDTTTNAVITTIKLGGPLYDIAINPQGFRLYISYFHDGVEKPETSVVDTRTNATVATFSTAGKLTVSPDGGRIYVIDNGEETTALAVIDARSNRVIAHPELADFGDVDSALAVDQLVVSPDGSRIYAKGGTLLTYVVSDLSERTETLFPVGVDGSLLGKNMQQVAISSDGSRIYAADIDSTGSIGQVTVVDTRTQAVIDTIRLGAGEANAIALTPSGNRAYVTNSTANRVMVVQL